MLLILGLLQHMPAPVERSHLSTDQTGTGDAEGDDAERDDVIDVGCLVASRKIRRSVLIPLLLNTAGQRPR